ncbi:hypothetical protein ABZ819_03265 [Streptomyces venezuelae]|uniref:dimethylarginine dimethylaminohydrolase family protein n=1 Tax=Streptomyces venezuelae TaxID=54571 RepID=UPI003426A104
MAGHPVQVQSEFARLRTVVLARSEFRAPDVLHPDDPVLRHLTPQHRHATLALQGKNLADAAPGRQRAWEQERDTFRALLERHGIEVLRPRLLTDAEKQATGAAGYSNFFTRDPWFTVGANVIEGALRFAHRRLEVLPSRPVLREHVLPGTAAYVAVPTPELGDAANPDGPGPFIEGGDVLVLGTHVLVGRSGLASDDAGFAWLRKFLEPQGFTVEQVPLQPQVLHLDCALGLVRQGLLLVCENRLVAGLPDALRAWDRISVSEDEAAALATNGLPLSSDVYVTDPAFSRIGDQLERHGVRVEYVDFAITRSFGGSFRCSTQPLSRVD